MAFKNERVTQEDVEKYELLELWEKYRDDEQMRVPSSPKYKASGAISILDSSGAYDWAIDRERENWLIYFARVKHKSWEEMRQSYTNERIFIFYFEGQKFEVRLILDDNNYMDKEINVFCYDYTWSLKSISPASKNEQKLKKLLKESLEVYGANGLFSAKDKNIITCLF